MDVRVTVRTGRSVVKSVVVGPRAEKVFAIGFNKTGTSSLHKVFRGLGYNSYHGTKWRDTSRRFFYRFFDAFSDGVPDDFRVLDETFPNAKFILQVRDLSPWLDSRLEHIRRLPPEKARHPEWTASADAVESWVRRWNSHHLDVLAHFDDRPDDLLVVNFVRDPHAASRIAAFLGHDGAIAKPHANRNPDEPRSLKNAETIDTVLSGLNVVEGERYNDIYCPSLAGDVPGVEPDTSAMREPR